MTTSQMSTREDIVALLDTYPSDSDVDLILDILERRKRVSEEREALKEERTAFWAKELDGLTNERFDDGDLVVEYVLATNPELRRRLRAALDEAFWPKGASS